MGQAAARDATASTTNSPTMFDRFLTYARAKRALRTGQFDAVLGLMDQPEVRRERRAEQLRGRALRGIFDRAQRRSKDGQVEAAIADVERILADAPEFDGAASLRGDLAARASAGRERVVEATEMRREARELAQQGDLAAAQRRCQEAAELAEGLPRGGAGGGAEQAAVERFIAGRQAAQHADIEAAEAALASADLRALRHHLARLGGARLGGVRSAGVSNPPEEFAQLHRRATSAIAKDLAQRLGSDADSAEVFDQLAADRLAFDGLLEQPELAAALDQLARTVGSQVRSLLEQGRLQTAVTTFQSAHPLLRGAGDLAALTDGMSTVREVLQHRDGGDLGRALECLRSAMPALRSVGVATERLAADFDELARADAQATAVLERARELAVQGQSLAAREELGAILEVWPMHEPVRNQMAILNEQAAARETQLQEARRLAGEARLAAASALLMGLAAESDEGREARLLLQDVHRRMDLAAHGLSQVRRAVHGQATANREGLRHCIARLDEVGKVQADLTELEELRDGLSAEIEGLDDLERAESGLERSDLAATSRELAAFEAVRPRLLHADRLDAKFQALADRVLQRAEADLHNARLSAAAAWLAVVNNIAAEHPMLRSRLLTMTSAVTDGQQRAASLLDAIARSSETGAVEVESAAGQLDEVRSIWLDSPRLEKLESRLLAMHSHADAADEVERLAGAGDVRGARRKLGEMPPTPGFLRTRIFDIKQGLAKAQGLEAGFLMRVDEGGEYLVVRSDSLTIGNVREGQADLLLLANIAGRHARIRRSMSFHGGMEDRIEAEKGKVFVNGTRVESATLKSGDRVRLGSALEFEYTMPSKRSLTSVLQLKNGFQVAGTDKIILLKDRGRDGRVLIGRALDSHIRVPHDEAEVEVYSSSDGQVRVRYAGTGDIGGKPFRGEHPVAAGALLTCGETHLVLQPWSGSRES